LENDQILDSPYAQRLDYAELVAAFITKLHQSGKDDQSTLDSHPVYIQATDTRKGGIKNMADDLNTDADMADMFLNFHEGRLTSRAIH
jgi:hypothetical protein